MFFIGFPMTIYYVGVRYLDSEDTITEDPTAYSFTTEFAARQYIDTLKFQPDVYDTWLTIDPS